MAMAPKRPCAVPMCPNLDCQVHQVEAWRTRRAPPPRVRGRKLQSMRARLFAKHPLCVLCLPKGVVSPSTIRDHTIPLGEGGLDDETNEQALCRTCSDAKTRAESARGLRRG